MEEATPRATAVQPGEEATAAATRIVTASARTPVMDCIVEPGQNAPPVAVVTAAAADSMPAIATAAARGRAAAGGASAARTATSTIARPAKPSAAAACSAADPAAAAHRRNSAGSMPAAATAAPPASLAEIRVQGAVFIAVVPPQRLSLGLTDAAPAVAAPEGIGGAVIQVVAEMVPQPVLGLNGHAESAHQQAENRKYAMQSHDRSTPDE